MLNYDLFAEKYLELVKGGGPRRAHGSIVRQLEIETSLDAKTVCDLGCGGGDLSSDLSGLGAVVTGVDTSQKLLEHARQLTDKVNWVHGSAMKLPSEFHDQSYDIVVSSLMLMDVPEHMAVFRESYRILKPGGIMVWLVMHPCFQSPFSHPLEDGSRQVYQYDPQFWKSHGDGTLRSTLGAYHRPLSHYLNDFMNAGFILKRTFEPGYEPAATQDASANKVPAHFGVVGLKKI